MGEFPDLRVLEENLVLILSVIKEPRGKSATPVNRERILSKSLNRQTILRKREFEVP